MSRLVVRAAVTVMLVSTATWMVSGPTVTATVLRAWARRMAVELLQLSLRLQGRTFGAPGLAAPAVNSEDGRGQPRWNERPGVTRRKRLGFPRGGSPLRGGSFRRVLRTQALRRGDCRAWHPQ